MKLIINKIIITNNMNVIKKSDLCKGKEFIELNFFLIKLNTITLLINF